MTDWEKFKITYLSKDLKTVRLNGDEYGCSHLDMTKYQSQDLVEVQIEKGKIVAIQFPPGLEPSQPSKTEIEKRMVEEVAHKQEKQYRIVHIGNGKLIASKGVEGDEICLTLKENALKFFKSFKAGDLVKWKYADNSTTDIVSLWKVNEDGSRPDKNNQYGQKPFKTVTLGGTINLQNYENIKIEVSGPYETLEDVKKLQNDLHDVCQLFGKDEITRGYVQNYCKRVIGGQS